MTTSNSTTAAAREAAAELLILSWYDAVRIGQGHDFGNGARGYELVRRRRALVEMDPGREILDALAELDQSVFTDDEIAAAWKRVGAPRCRRAQRDWERFGSNGAIRTGRTWKRAERQFDRSA